MRKLRRAAVAAITVVALIPRVGAAQEPVRRLPAPRAILVPTVPNPPGLVPNAASPQGVATPTSNSPSPYYPPNVASPPSQQWATGCYTQWGECDLPPFTVAAGTNCACPSQYGALWGAAQ
jgi:hypothetical protein